MIELKAADYCHECPKFSATSRSKKLYVDGKPCVVIHEVYCEHESFCCALREMWQNNMNKEEK